MLEGVLQVITQPVSFFRRLAEDETLSRFAFVIVLIIAALTAVVSYFSALPSADALGDMAFGRMGLIFAPVGGVIAALLAWLIYGLLIRIGAGTHVKPWALAAYSSAPQILILTIMIVLAALFPVEVRPVTVDPSDAEAFRAAMAEVQTETQQSLFGRSSQFLGYLSSAWQLVLIYLGLSVSTSRNKAITGTVLVAILALGFLLMPFLFATTG